MLFKATQKNSQHIHYIMGTMHLANDEAYTFMNKAEQSLRKVNRLATEIDFFDSSMSNTDDIYQFPKPYSLKALYRPNIYEKVKKAIQKSTSIDIEALDHYTPLFIMNMIGMSYLSTNKLQNCDFYLALKARSWDIETYGLESLSDYHKILEKIPLEVQAKMLKDLASNTAKARRYAHNTVDLYVKGNIHLLHKTTKGRMGRLRRPILIERNLAMAEKAYAMFQEVPTMIAIGAAHLSGDQGVLALLKRKGLKIERI